MNEEKSEFKLIEWMRRQRQGGDAKDVIAGIGDDMAVVRVGGRKLLITTDVLLEGVHFDLERATPEQVGYKAMACSLSDCAAMAAVPFVAVAAVALPQTMTMGQAKQLYQGLQEAAEKYNCPIVGGDTTSWDKPLTIDVTMLAKVGATEPIPRSGAQIGDTILVTGELGGSLQGKHLRFSPRVNESQLLAQMVELHAMIDISDGLSIDLNHICCESKVAAEIDAQAIPVSQAVRSSAEPLTAALSDGEDFELLFCVSPSDAEKLLREWPGRSSVRLSSVGRIIQAKGEQRLFIRQADGTVEPLEVKGWEHFREL